MKKFLVGYIAFLLLWCIGCSTPQQQVNIDYLRCNATSTGDMAEIESGFFLK